MPRRSRSADGRGSRPGLLTRPPQSTRILVANPGYPSARGARGSGGFVVEKARQAWYDETTEMFREGLKAFFWTLAGVFLIVS